MKEKIHFKISFKLIRLCGNNAAKIYVKITILMTETKLWFQ